jgi:hypothetical protein
MARRNTYELRCLDLPLAEALGDPTPAGDRVGIARWAASCARPTCRGSASGRTSWFPIPFASAGGRLVRSRRDGKTVRYALTTVGSSLLDVVATPIGAPA